MHWLYLLASLFCMGLAMRANLSGWAVASLIVLALGLLIAWMLGWMASRLSGVSRSDASLISVDELRRLRMQAEARKNSDAAATTPERSA